MFINIFKVLVLLFFLNIKPLYSKNTNNTDFNTKNLSSYFSALVSLENQQNKDSLKFFNHSRSLINFHKPYIKKYVNSLVLEGKIKRAAHELKVISNENNKDFFDAHLILFLDSIKNEKNIKSREHLKKLLEFKGKGPFETVIVESLSDFFYVFQNKREKPINKELTIV